MTDLTKIKLKIEILDDKSDIWTCYTETTLADFCGSNTIEPGERDFILSLLARDRPYYSGGGSEPLFRVTVIHDDRLEQSRAYMIFWGEGFKDAKNGMETSIVLGDRMRVEDGWTLKEQEGVKALPLAGCYDCTTIVGVCSVVRIR